MKKSHEYDSPVLSRLVSIVTVLAICVCSLCCVVSASKIATISGGGVQTVVSDNGGSGSGGSGGSGSGGSGSGSSGSGSQPSSDSNSGSGDASADSSNSGGDASYADILAKYTEVMNNLKTGVATYEKKEFQKLADDYDLGTVGNLVLPIAENIMTSEDKAEIQNRDDAAQIPVVRCEKGCLLTDDSQIAKATMTESGGKTTIVIVLKDEVGSLPYVEGEATAPSYVGSMFNPLDKAGIDNIVDKFKSVATINSFELTYKECTATLVFDTETGHVESLEQIMNVLINVDAKVTLLKVSGYATLINTMRINNVNYK